VFGSALPGRVAHLSPSSVVIEQQPGLTAQRCLVAGRHQNARFAVDDDLLQRRHP
jgi:hypothetical protein